MSASNRQFDTGAQRDSREDKGRFDLIPVFALTEVAKHFGAGADRYGERNWEKGQPLSVYLDSALRHTFKALAGEVDEKHAVAAVWNLLAFIETQHRVDEGRLPESLDDMPYKQGLEVANESERAPYVPMTSNWTQCRRCRGCACLGHWKQTDKFSRSCQCDYPEVA